jgi:predicted XRE-type DNA-binding protein
MLVFIMRMAGLPDDRLLALRRTLSAAIVHALGPDAQHNVSTRFGIPQPRMSELSRGIVGRCTLEWLIRRIHLMGGSVTITVELGDVAGDYWRARFRERRARPDGSRLLREDQEP